MPQQMTAQDYLYAETFKFKQPSKWVEMKATRTGFEVKISRKVERNKLTEEALELAFASKHDLELLEQMGLGAKIAAFVQEKTMNAFEALVNKRLKDVITEIEGYIEKIDANVKSSLRKLLEDIADGLAQAEADDTLRKINSYRENISQLIHARYVNRIERALKEAASESYELALKLAAKKKLIKKDLMKMSAVRTNLINAAIIFAVVVIGVIALATPAGAAAVSAAGLIAAGAYLLAKSYDVFKKVRDVYFGYWKKYDDSVDYFQKRVLEADQALQKALRGLEAIDTQRDALFAQKRTFEASVKTCLKDLKEAPKSAQRDLAEKNLEELGKKINQIDELLEDHGDYRELLESMRNMLRSQCLVEMTKKKKNLDTLMEYAKNSLDVAADVIG